MRYLVPEQFTVRVREPLIPMRLYKMVASMEAAIFNCQCDQMQNCDGGCETMYYVRSLTTKMQSNFVHIKSVALKATWTGAWKPLKCSDNENFQSVLQPR